MSYSLNNVNNTNNSNLLRITGMATGLDTDNIIKQLMQAESAPLTRLNQKNTQLEWKQDAYRDITNSLRAFKDTYFDVLKPATNMLSGTSFNKSTITSSSPEVATAIGGSGAQPGTHTLTVTQLATSASTASSTAVTKDLTGTLAAGLAFVAGTNDEFKITLNGVTKTLTLRDGAYASTAELITNGSSDGIQNLVDAAFGAGKITVSETAVGSGILKFTAANSKITISSGTNDALGVLNIASGASNRISTSSTLANLSLKTGLVFDGGGNVSFTINGADFSFSSDTTLSAMMGEINNSSANVTMTYSELTDTFSIVSKTKGTGNAINITNTTGNLFDAVAGSSAIHVASGNVTNGKDAIFNLDTTNGIVRNDNQFTIDGISYTALSLGATTISVAQDVNSTYDTIKSFVDKYNEIITNINTKLSEKTYRTYQPLTTEQKAELSETEVKLWEAKAKSGLLRSDTILQKMVTDMRRALFDGISGISGGLTEIGITTGTWETKGMLVIDETKLKNAIAANPTKVRDLFSKASTTAYEPGMSAADRATRYGEEGVAQRLFDILQDNIRTTRDDKGKKGFLIEKAGITGDVSEFSNLIYKEISQNNTAINSLTVKLAAKEVAYYKRFAAMEKAIAQMGSQSSWLSQQTNG